MKKFYAIAMSFAAAAMTFASCANDDTATTGPKLSGQTKTISVTTAITRTTIDDAHKLSWVEGDQYGIFYADNEGNIIGYTESPEYTGEEEYKLEVPAEAEYLYCFYPLSAVSNKSVTGTNKIEFELKRDYSYSDDLDLSYLTYMAAKTQIQEDSSATIKFQMLNAIVEFNIYDSTGEDTSNITSLRINAKNCSGPAELSFEYGEDLTLDEGIYSFVGMDIISFFYEVPVGSADEPTKLYLPIIKGTYEDFEFAVTTEENGTLKYNKGQKSLEQDYYTAKIDVNNSDEDNGEVGGGDIADFTTAEIASDLGFGDADATINYFREFNSTVEDGANVNENWGSIQTSRTLDITSGGTSDMVAVKLGTWPGESAKIFTDAQGRETASDSTFAGGVLTLYGYGKYWVIFYITEEGVQYPYGYLYVNYHKDDNGGDDNGDDEDDTTFIISSEGAKITKATGSEDWATNVTAYLTRAGHADDLVGYWELQYTSAANDAVTFSSMPAKSTSKWATTYFFLKATSWEGVTPDWNKEDVWFTYPNGYSDGTPTLIKLHGDDSSDTTEYVVVLPEQAYGEAAYVIHVIYTDSLDGDDNNGDGGDEGGNDSGTFTLADNNYESVVSLKKKSDSEAWAKAVKEWNGEFYATDLQEFWELTVTGTDSQIYFTSCPKWTFSEDDEYYNPLLFYKSGDSWTPDFTNTKEYWQGMWHDTSSDGYKSFVDVLGEAWKDSSADYVVLFREQGAGPYDIAKYALHVVYSSK